MLNLCDLFRIKGFRFPRSVIGYAVCVYHRFALSLRDVEDLLASLEIQVSYETVRGWVARFGAQFAARIRCDRPGPADKWHVDDVVISIKGNKHWLCPAVNANGDVMESCFSRVGTPAQSNVSFESCSCAGASRACWSRTSLVPTLWPKPILHVGSNIASTMR